MPIYSRSYRYPQIHRSEVDRQVKDMLDKSIIRHSTSPYSFPLWVVPKKSIGSSEKEWRVVLDFRKLNEITVADQFPIPNIDNILDKLGNSVYNWSR